MLDFEQFPGIGEYFAAGLKGVLALGLEAPRRKQRQNPEYSPVPQSRVSGLEVCGPGRASFFCQQ